MARVIPRIIIATTDKTHCYQAPASIGMRKTSEGILNFIIAMKLVQHSKPKVKRNSITDTCWGILVSVLELLITDCILPVMSLLSSGRTRSDQGTFWN